jgi:hypothetical protein
MPDVYVTLTRGKIHSSTEHDGFVIDYDSFGNVTGVEVRNAIGVDVDSGIPMIVSIQEPEPGDGLNDGPGDSGNHSPTV